MKAIFTDEIQEEFKKNGLYYSKETIFNFYLSLVTKPFVILSGISGSGKSKIAETFARMTADGIKNYELIPVKPNWRDSKGIFGYHNLIDNTYYSTPAIRLFIRALKNPQTPFFLVLDEMNIAKTEHYFADYLSLIESRHLENLTDGTTDEFSEEEFDNLFHYKRGTTLSEAIILAALDINSSEALSVEKYRSNRFSIKWKKQFFNGEEGNWTPQFRTELNGEGRLAHRVFEGGNNSYKLKDVSMLDERDREIVLNLKEFYQSLLKKKEVVQDSIVLHENSICLSTNGKCCNCTVCPYKASEKYKCEKLYDSESETYYIPPEIPIPLNLYTIGTVNIDETTYMFSPKVLDRSNVIEFNSVDFSALYDIAADNTDINAVLNRVKNPDLHDYFFFKSGLTISKMLNSIPSKDKVDLLISREPAIFVDLILVYEILQKYNLGFGYRVVNEICSYICNALSLSGNKDCIIPALDYQFLQKVLPKLSGSYEKLFAPLTEILGFMVKEKEKVSFKNLKTEKDLLGFYSEVLGKETDSIVLKSSDAEQFFKYPLTTKKISRMVNDLIVDGFAAYIK